MRVAVAQFATSLNTQENLATCIRMIADAALCQPSMIVLPEYCNTQPNYENHNQAWQQALALEGDFLQQIAAQAKLHNCYIVLNVSLRRDLARDDQNPLIKSNISLTSCTFSPSGELIYQADNQRLLAHESEFFISTQESSKSLTTPIGKIGFLSGSEAFSSKITRELALKGAELICNSQSLNRQEQTTLYDFARACENNLFIATAKNIASSGSRKDLNNTSQSQILALNGKALATLTSDKEGVVFADIEIEKAGLNKHKRPDGTNVLDQRRPELYQQSAVLTKSQQPEAAFNKLPNTANVVLFATYKSNEQAIEDVCFYIENNLSDIIQLPELFFVADKSITNNAQDLLEIETICDALINQISAVLRPFQYVCTSLVINGSHHAVLISEQGIFATQQQLHFCNRYQWSTLGDQLNIVELPLEQGSISIAMLTADDANIPELVNVAAVNKINVLLVPFDIQTSCEVDFSILSLAAEHGICIVASSREKNFIDEQSTHKNTPILKAGNIKKVKPQKSTGLVVDIIKGRSLSQKNNQASIIEYTNIALANLKIKQQHGKITKALVHPSETLKPSLNK